MWRGICPGSRPREKRVEEVLERKLLWGEGGNHVVVVVVVMVMVS